MANLNIGVPDGFVDKRVGRGVSGNTILAENTSYGNINEMRTRLIALKPATYTNKVLDTMTYNDIVYALRQESSDSAGIK